MLFPSVAIGVVVTLVLCIALTEQSIGQEPKSRCGQWLYGPCENLNKNGGKCGKGTKKAIRTGNTTACHPIEKMVKCRIPCPDDKKVCKYRQGRWSECNPTTLKRIRTDMLMVELSDPSCAATRPFEKRCKKKLCSYGKWTEYGPCQNGYHSRTRPILSGALEQCEARSKKTKRCRSSTPRGNTPVATG